MVCWQLAPLVVVVTLAAASPTNAIAQAAAGSGVGVSDRIVGFRADADRLRSQIAESERALLDIEAERHSEVATYTGSVTQINDRLQGGTTPSNPELVDAWQQAQTSLAKLDGTIGSLSQVSGKLSEAMAFAGYLKTSVTAAYALAGARDSDHEQLVQVEHSAARDADLLKQLSAGVTREIEQQSAALVDEHRNNLVLRHAIEIGARLGNSLANGGAKPVSLQAAPAFLAIIDIAKEAPLVAAAPVEAPKPAEAAPPPLPVIEPPPAPVPLPPPVPAPKPITVAAPEPAAQPVVTAAEPPPPPIQPAPAPVVAAAPAPAAPTPAPKVETPSVVATPTPPPAPLSSTAVPLHAAPAEAPPPAKPVEVAALPIPAPPPLSAPATPVNVPSPTAIPSTSLPAGKPLFVVDSHQSIDQFEAKLYESIAKVLAHNPDATIQLIAVSPTGDGSASEASRRQATAIADALDAFGIPAEHVKISFNDGAALKSGEVRVYTP